MTYESCLRRCSSFKLIFFLASALIWAGTRNYEVDMLLCESVFTDKLKFTIESFFTHEQFDFEGKQPILGDCDMEVEGARKVGSNTIIH